MKKVEYFFEPSIVAKVLKPYNGLQTVFGDMAEVGKPCLIEGVRKSPIVMVHWFGGYEFQAPMCKKINAAIDYGWITKRDICTTDITQFESMLTEVDLMFHYEAKGFTVSRPIQSEDNHRADILITMGNNRVCTEVYTPRNWDGYDAFQQELKNHISFFDVPFNFSYSIHYEQINRYRKGNGSIVPFYFDPVVFSDATNTTQKRWDIIETTLNSLDFSSLDKEQKVEFQSLNMRLVIRFSQLEPPKSRLFHRVGVTVPFGLTLSSNFGELMFKRLLHRSLAKKIKRRQALTGSGTATALIVDCSYMPTFLFSDFTTEAVGRSISVYDSSDLVDVLGFCTRNGSSTPKWLWIKSKVPEDTIVEILK